jgi:hypothetical protein
LSQYIINGRLVSKTAPDWQPILKDAYNAKIHPLCGCKQLNHPKLYISKFLESFVLKRMPFSGATHSVECDHYEQPAEISGMSQIDGTAIKVNTTTDMTTLSLDFPLKKGVARTAITSDNIEEDSVRADGTKLTLRATLHYIYAEAALTTWVPRMQGKRSWFVVRRELLNAAHQMRAKSFPLDDLLFIPETFHAESVADIDSRTTHRLKRLAESPNNRMLIIAEVKALEAARFGHRIVAKHLPQQLLYLNDELYARLIKAFSTQLELWAAHDDSHLLLIGTFFRSPSGNLTLERVCLMNVNQQWIPFETINHLTLINHLHESQRRFIRSLRYNLKSSQLIATATLTDTGDIPTALYMTDETQEEEFTKASESLRANHQMATWAWKLGSGPIPPLPSITPYATPTASQ